MLQVRFNEHAARFIVSTPTSIRKQTRARAFLCPASMIHDLQDPLLCLSDCYTRSIITQLSQCVA